MATTGLSRATEAAIERLAVSAYEVPTERPESDGTFEWESTTIIVVEVEGGGHQGLGYTYGDVAVATLIDSRLREAVEGRDALSPPAAWAAMQRALRNAGRPGVGAMAVSAVDIALWDLKARLLEASLADLVPRFHLGVPIYGSGGFTSYSDEELRRQLSGWAQAGVPRVKMKVGRDPDRDRDRVGAARTAVGEAVELMVDANGAYDRKQALAWAERFAELGVSWLEEPLSSEDTEGLRLVRDRGPGSLAIAAGEYAWDLIDLQRLLDAGAVDVLQADVTRVGGVTNMLRVDGLCKASQVPFSAHCAPAISAHVCCALETLAHLEYFHDHVRVERLLFDGVLEPHGGNLEPDRDRPGLGLELKRADAAEFELR